MLSRIGFALPMLAAIALCAPLTTPLHAQSTDVLPKLKVVFAARQRNERGVPTGMQQLYTADGDGSRLARVSPLGENAYHDWPVWALNGTRIVFSARLTVEDTGQEGIYMSRPDGTDVVNLVASDWPVGQPKLSADGQTLLFTGSWPQFRGTALYQLSMRTGLVENLTAQTPKAVHDSDGRWSLDGQTMVFAGLGDDVNGDRPAQVMASDAAGGNRQRITHDTWHDVDPMLSPDGRYVAYSSYRGQGHPLDSGQIVGPETDVGTLRVHLNDWQLIVHDITTGTQRSLTQGKNCPEQGWWEACQPAEGPAWVPVWLPDGKHLAYLSARSGLDTGIYAIGADGSGARILFESRDLVLNWHDWALADGPGVAPAPVASPAVPRGVLWGGVMHELDPKTGAEVPTRAAFVTTPDLWFGRRLEPADSEGRTLPVHSARWTPDRQQILFTSPVAVPDATVTGDDTQTPTGAGASGSTLDQLFLMNANGSEVRQLTSPTTEDALEPLAYGEARANTDPDMSPDGRYVIFSSKATNGLASLLRLDMISGEVINLTSMTSGILPTADLHAHFSPDGSRIALAALAQSVQVSLISSDGRNFRTVTDDAYDNTDPAWSPDGRWLVYVQQHSPTQTGDAESVATADLVKINVETGQQVVLAETNGQISLPTWAPDGNSIVCVALPAFDHIDDFVQSDIYQVNSNGGPLRPLAVTLSTSEAFVDWR